MATWPDSVVFKTLRDHEAPDQLKWQILLSHCSFMLHLPLIEFARYLKRNLIKIFFPPSPKNLLLDLQNATIPKNTVLNKSQMQMPLTDIGQWVLDWESAWSSALRHPTTTTGANTAALWGHWAVFDKTRSKSTCTLARRERGIDTHIS